MALPALRQELALYPGPRSPSGEPTWSLHDPVRNLFFQLDWLSFEIISRWQLQDGDNILRQVAEKTPIQPEADDLEAVLRFLNENELVQRHSREETAWFAKQQRKQQLHPLRWLMHRYLFFRIPLWRPDRRLGRALPWVAPFYSRGFIGLTLAALLFALLEVSRQWEPFVSTMVDHLSPAGLVSFFIALVFAKFMHELGHAFTAKRYGCRVPTMGVAFLVMFPVAYTDVNEAWKLRSRRQRLLVGAAGISTELIIAAWATFLWGLLPDGFLRSAVFVLATTTWVSTLLVNASPFLRFDGYFLLMDWLGMPNLHQRAFALGKWFLRRTLFGLNDPPPETLRPSRERGVILFAYAIWLYRLVVFGGIALLVFTLFPKPLGPVLAGVELWWFILLPVVREVKEWHARIGEIVRGRRIRWVATLLLLFVLLLLFPWDNRIHIQGILRPAGYFPLAATEAVRVVAMPVANGQWVAEGEVVLELDSPDLDHQQRIMEERQKTLRWQGAAAGVAPQLLEQRQTLEAQGAKLQAELSSVREEKNRFQLRAPQAGHLFLSDLDLQTGDWIGRNEQLATLVDAAKWQVVSYLPESEVQRVQVGDTALFFDEAAEGVRLKLHVQSIDHDATRLLADGLLAATNGGHVRVRETRSGLVPESAVYRVVLATDEAYAPANPQLRRGQLVLFGKAKSWLGVYARHAVSVLVREAGF